MLKTIVKSRFKKDSEENWIKERREICKNCPQNTLNLNKITLKIRILIRLSKIYSFITGDNREYRGNCSVCGCDVTNLTNEEAQDCSNEEPKWKSIYIPNKK